ncbi:MAG: hypothetical protein BGO21_28145 [Dyadobacter sp. 50-39]|uniref:hypothetical protein n=1 Tax=Dyadobacter sp. 50-39 TaxID=1895756 RepID=UPI00096A0FD2|nr:hypothetical protein [Dyadobacter sp. 50-39]OJV16738.1 MAG: hypothetical protein BGO21_28145 [Dyadobacter sp. 50-39]
MKPIDDKQEAHFKKLIREAAADAPSDAFTRAVMQRVHEETAFHALMQRNAAETPPATFSSEVMAQIRASHPVATPKPVISRRIWYGIAAGWLALLVACFFLPGNEPQPAFFSQLNAQMMSNQVFSQQLHAIPQPVMLTVIGLACLVLIDYFLRDRWAFLQKMARS